MAPELKARKTAILKALNEVQQERRNNWNRWMDSAKPWNIRQTALREYYGACGAIRELRNALIQLKRAAQPVH